MTRDQALERIRKCLALSKSTNSNEAAVALRQAQKLMESFNVDVGEAHAPTIGEFSVSAASKTGAGWEGAMASVVASSLGLRVYRKVTKINRKAVGAGFIYYGNADRVELAEYAHENLRRAIIAARKTYVRGLKGYPPRIVRSRSRGFAFGFCAEITSAVRSLVETAEESAAIAAWKAKKSLTLRSAGRSSRIDGNGYGDGKAAGSAFGMNRPISGLGAVAGYLR